MAADPHPKPSESTPQQLQKLALKIAGEGQLRITVSGISMEPLFSPGDAVLVDSTLRKNPGVGKIVTFITGEILVTHRIVAKETNGYLLKGDNAQSFDPLVGEDEIVGVVVAIDRNGSWQALHSHTMDRIITLLSRWDGNINQMFAGNRSPFPRYLRGGTHRIIKALIRLIYHSAGQTA